MRFAGHPGSVESTDPEVAVRKFILNTSVLSSVFGAFGVVQTTRKGPRDWRLILMWIGWACTLAVAVGTVVKQAQTGNEIKE